MRRSLLTIAFLLAAAAPACATNYTLTLSTTGPVGTSVISSSNPATGIQCGSTNTACSASFLSGSTVTLTLVAGSTTAFVGWSGAQGCKTNLPTCNVLMSGAAAVTAAFDPILDLYFSGNGLGVVASTGVYAYSNATAAGVKHSFVYPAGTAIVLHASTGTASSFVGWTGDAGCSNASTCTFTLNGYESIVATFTANGTGPYTLAVTVPNGGGTVTSSPAGIATAVGVFFSTFAANASVTLTTAAAAGYRFAGWSNAGCHGKAKCVVVSTSPLQGLGGQWSPSAYFYKPP